MNLGGRKETIEPVKNLNSLSLLFHIATFVKYHKRAPIRDKYEKWKDLKNQKKNWKS